MAQTYSLPPLPFAYDALEPVISTQIMELHHAKHHNTYVANLNKALQDQMEAIKAGNIRDQVNLHAIISFNAGGHINHSLFWANLAPLGAPETKVDAAPKLWEAIRQRWGEDDGVFRQKFSEALLGIRGSGWAWLVRQGTQGPLAIVTTHDQDIVAKDEVPIFGIDMWEHAYYLQYLNGKAAYVKNIWAVINWKTAEERYLGGSVDAFKDLRASI
ncbi:Superoxide dismutase [Mn], mitochondrial [Blastomyces dermatitidis]|uniref:Superoxide dismutase n=6 Tax=Blastomyces TaxID=229219 RepID=A0A179V481_BLAGS|nr:superoxide dismutase [Mn], mitochondrial [Blastomyces gilchristii SLH14081]XP_045277056.1 superoxide dismutase [Mn], mitochondrial [Blastomyces dermatitidis ER-3]EGE80666.2 superoxide dismutase [Mn], mitochondrial [Blastomyces dermatitidis ATCC 18188]EQL29459.1 superoxide dismutase [Mn], mitochondrial [Blastomyces dermatitidis ATCC 26199]EEQ90301.1 superoxide dismutase [Mn], mitochondrial [Blastomyces dermatitidis ER-3]OAT14278.1 superoxide dismutase [Mn], mitochondrial [Blastomyces gilchri